MCLFGVGAVFSKRQERMLLRVIISLDIARRIWRYLGRYFVPNSLEMLEKRVPSGERIRESDHSLQAPSGVSTKNEKQCPNISKMKLQ